MPKPDPSAVNTESKQHPFENKKGTTAFITGASGLVGVHLIKELLKRGIAIRALYRSEIPAEFINSNIEWIKGDILDVIALEEG